MLILFIPTPTFALHVMLDSRTAVGPTSAYSHMTVTLCNVILHLIHSFNTYVIIRLCAPYIIFKKRNTVPKALSVD